MSIPVRIPTPLRKLTSDQEVVAAEGTTVREVINDLDKHFPGLKDRICDEKDNVRRFVNVFVNDEDIRFLNESDTSLKAGDEISIVPAIAGG
jgi:molybdopterin synthase sulfur carrier subunit